MEQPVEITLQEAYHGTTRLLQKDSQRLEVRIPAGAKTGTRVRMSGEGGAGSAGAPTGDLYLRVGEDLIWRVDPLMLEDDMQSGEGTPFEGYLAWPYLRRPTIQRPRPPLSRR